MLQFNPGIPVQVLAFFSDNPAAAKYNRKSDPRIQRSVIINHMDKQLFTLAETIAAGAEGKVKKGYLANGTACAIKIIHLEQRYTLDSQEIPVLSKLGRLIGHTSRKISETTQREYIFQTLIEGVPLERLLRALVLSPEQKLSIAINLVQELKMLFEKHRIVHGDVKPSNLMVNNLEVKMVDFGFAKILSPERNYVQGLTNESSPLYAAPEVENNKIYSPASDIHSLGLMFKMDFGFPSRLYEAMLHPNPALRPNHDQILGSLKEEQKQRTLFKEKGVILKAGKWNIPQEAAPSTKPSYTLWRRGYY